MEVGIKQQFSDIQVSHGSHDEVCGGGGGGRGGTLGKSGS